MKTIHCNQRIVELATDKGGPAVEIPADVPIAAIALALSYVGGILRWNISRRRLEVISIFRGNHE